jgi:hypothetical protein
VVRVELDPGRTRGGTDDVRAAMATIVPPDAVAGGAARRLTLAWVSEDTLEARFPVQKSGLYLGAVQVGNSVLPLAPLSLPYSPEFEPRQDPAEGRKTLSEMASVTGGVERTTWDDVFKARGLRNRQVRDLVIPLTLVLLGLHVAEIGGRRLLLFDAVRGWLRTVRIPTLRRRWRRAAVPAPAAAKNGERSTLPETSASGSDARVVPSKPAASPLARAKAKARDRMGG